MEKFSGNFLQAVFQDADADPFVDVACVVAQAFGEVVTESDEELWVDRVAPRVWELLEHDVLVGQLNLFECWPEVVDGLPARFLSKLSDEQRREVRSLPSGVWKAQALVKLLDDLAGVKYEPEPFHPLVIPRPGFRSVVVDGREGDLPVAPSSAVAPLSGFSLLESLPAWRLLLPAGRAVFTVMYRRAHRSKSAAQPWCQVSVGLLMKATGYKNTQVRNALAQLRRGRWVGFIVRGRPQLGGSRYWVATSPSQLGVRLTASVLADLGFKT